MGFSKQEYWSELPFPPPGDLPNTGTEPHLSASCINRRILYCRATGEALVYIRDSIYVSSFSSVLLEKSYTLSLLMGNPYSVHSSIKDQRRGWLGQAEIPHEGIKRAKKLSKAPVWSFCSCRRSLEASHLYPREDLATPAHRAISSRANSLSSWSYPTLPHTPARRLHWADPGSLHGSWQMAPCGLIRKSDKKIRPPLPFARNWDCLDFNHSHS